MLAPHTSAVIDDSEIIRIRRLIGTLDGRVCYVFIRGPGVRTHWPTL